MVVAVIALFVALGGVAGAATTMITTKMIADNAVTRGKIAQNSINSAKIEDGSIQSKDLASNIRGEKGVAGPKGDTGPRGPQGEQGLAGPRGAQGEAGPVGATGAAGPAGVAGATGAAGPTGATGSAGPPGVDGKSILSGSTDPSSGVGVNGDFYINTATDSLFGPKASGVWPSGESLVGPAGAAGAVGPSDIQYRNYGQVDLVSGGSSGVFVKEFGTLTLTSGSWVILFSATVRATSSGTPSGNFVIRNDANDAALQYHTVIGASDKPYGGSAVVMHAETIVGSKTFNFYVGVMNVQSGADAYASVVAIKTGNLTAS